MPSWIRFVYKYLLDNECLYKNHIASNPRFDSYDVIVDGKTYSINYKFKENFLSNLKNSLVFNHCDKKAIEAISYL